MNGNIVIKKNENNKSMNSNISILIDKREVFNLTLNYHGDVLNQILDFNQNVLMTSH